MTSAQGLRRFFASWRGIAATIKNEHEGACEKNPEDQY
jgi:hypothetical protein